MRSASQNRTRPDVAEALDELRARGEARTQEGRRGGGTRRGERGAATTGTDNTTTGDRRRARPPDPPTDSAGLFGAPRANEARRGGPRAPREEPARANFSRPNRDRPPEPGGELASAFSARRPPSSLAPSRDQPPHPNSVVAGDELSRTSFFGPDPASATGVDMPPPPPGPVVADDVDLLADELAELRASYGDTEAFEPGPYFGQEPTPALLAAKAEPLGDPQARRPNRKSQRTAKPAGRSLPKSSRSAAASEAARASKSRAQTRRKPKEPSKILLAVAVLGVILVGVAAGYYVTRGGDESASPPATTVGDTGTSTPTGETTASTASLAAPASDRPPSVRFDDAARGPVDSAVPHTITVDGGPSGATYQLLVDDVAQAEPAAQLPPVTFTPGRHLLVIDITSAEGNVATDPVVVYALGEVPAPGYRANLASVNTQTEGWGEAVRRFDEYVSQGHANLKLMPSDPYPSLKPGYWNIFVDGFANDDAAKAYCTQYSLSVPDQCFSRYFDASAPAPASG